MHSVSYLETLEATPCTPASNYDLKVQYPASASQLHTSSHKKSSFSALKSPLKSLRSRRKTYSPINQSPTTLKRNPSLFDLFHSARSRVLDTTEASKDGISVSRPKTTSPAKNIASDNEYKLAGPKRSKSFGELLGTNISNRVSSKNNTASQCGQRHADISHNIQPSCGLYSINNTDWDWIIMPETGEAYIFSAQQEQRIQQLEAEMDTFWRHEQGVDSLKPNQTENHLRLDPDCESSANSWESSSHTLHDAEGPLLGRSTPKFDDRLDICILPEPYLEPWLSPPKYSLTASYDSKYYMTRLPWDSDPFNQPCEGSLCKAKHRNNILLPHECDLHRSRIDTKFRFNGGRTYPVLRGRLAAKRVVPQTFNIKQSPPRATNDASIAERIQLTVGEMTNNRYMNYSVDGPDLKFVDQILADSVHIRTPPSICCSSVVALPYKIDSIQQQTTKEGTSTLDSQQPSNGQGIVNSKLRVDGQKGRRCLRQARQASTEPVRVKFPGTKSMAAYIGHYTSSSKAISDIFEKNHGQLSNVCAYDRENRTIHVYSLQCAPNSNELQQHGLEPIWLPQPDNLGTEGLLDAILANDTLFRKDSLSLSPSVSTSTLSSSVNGRTLMEDIGMDKQSRTPSQPLAESSTVPQIYHMPDENSRPSKHISVANLQPLTESLSPTDDSRTKMQAKPSVGRNSNLSFHMAMEGDDSYKVKIDPVTKCLLRPRSTYDKYESDSDNGSIFKFEYSSEPDSFDLSKLSGSSEEYDRIMMGTESDIGYVDLRQSCLDPDSELDFKKEAHEGASIDTWRRTGLKRNCIDEKPLSQQRYFIGTTKKTSGTPCHTAQSHAGMQHLADNRKYFARRERHGPKVSAKHKTSLYSSPKSQLNITGVGGEPNSELSYTSGFPFTAYATQLLPGGRCGSDDHSDSMNEGERERPIISRHHSGGKLPLKRRKKVDQLLNVVKSRHNGEMQSVTASRDLQHKPSNSINVLPGIAEAGEIDGMAYFAGNSAKSLDNSAEQQQKFTNDDKNLDNDIPGSYCKGSCDCTSEPSTNSPIGNKQKNVAGLVEIFQARGMIGPTLALGLQRTQKLFNPIHQCNGGVSGSPTRIVTPSGAVYSPSGAPPRPSYCPSSVKRVSPHSLSLTNTILDDADIEASSMLSEQLGRFEEPTDGSSGNGQLEGSEWYFRDGYIYG